MKTLIFYFNVKAARAANERQHGRVDWRRFVRIRSISNDDVRALDCARPKRGETVVNTVIV